VSRSTTVVLAFRMKTKRWPLKKALAYVKQRRYIVDPNFGFVEQLRKFEETLGLSPPAEGDESKTAS
jgi:protein-tyrosine phosphatase